MKPRNHKELARLSGEDCRALVAEFMGIDAEPQEGCRLDWLTFAHEPLLVESEYVADHYGSGWVAKSALVNGNWLDLEEAGIDSAALSEQVDKLHRRELADARAQEAA